MERPAPHSYGWTWFLSLQAVLAHEPDRSEIIIESPPPPPPTIPIYTYHHLPVTIRFLPQPRSSVRREGRWLPGHEVPDLVGDLEFVVFVAVELELPAHVLGGDGLGGCERRGGKEGKKEKTW